MWKCAIRLSYRDQFREPKVNKQQFIWIFIVADPHFNILPRFCQFGFIFTQSSPTSRKLQQTQASVESAGHGGKPNRSISQYSTQTNEESNIFNWLRSGEHCVSSAGVLLGHYHLPLWTDIPLRDRRPLFVQTQACPVLCCMCVCVCSTPACLSQASA